MKQLETTYKILSSDCDRFGIWKANRILVMLQELAGEHSEILGFSFADTLKLGAVWVVTRTEFEVLAYPKIAQTVVGRTFPGRGRRGIYPRYYHISDQAGRPLVRGSSFWVLADANTRQMTDLAQVQANMPDTSSLSQPFGNPSAPMMLEEGQRLQSAITPVYTDLDRNGHVNNTRPADWALCLLSQAADLQRHPLRSLQASYHQEMLEGQPLGLELVQQGLNFSFLCQAEGQVALRLGGSLFDQLP